MESKNKENGKWLAFDDFRANFRSLAESRGMLYKDIAERISVPRPTISRYMSGAREPEIEYIYRIADLFGVTIDYLLGLSGDRHSKFTTDAERVADLYTMASKEDKLVINTVLRKYEKKSGGERTK